MRSMVIFGIALLLVAALAFTLRADENGGKTGQGFSAQIDAGIGWERTESNIEPGDDNKRLTSLDQAADSETQIIPAAFLELRYDFGTGLAVYGGVPLGDEPRAAMGFEYETKRMGDFDIAFFHGFGDEVWEDPYLVGVDRRETDLTEYGGSIAWTLRDLELSYEMEIADVDRDAVGIRLPDLRRDGTIHTFEGAYEFELGEGVELVPSLYFEQGSMDGKSNEYQGYGAGLQLKKMWENFMFMVSLEAGKAEYDAVHPIFCKTREDDNFGAMAVLSWNTPLGFERFRVMVGAGYEETDSGIDFYDSKEVMTFLTIGYRFGGGGHGRGDDDD